MLQRTVKILFITLAHQVHRIDSARYALHRQIDVVFLQDMGHNIRYHRSKGYHEHHRILPRRPVDAHPVDPHTVLHEPEGMLHLIFIEISRSTVSDILIIQNTIRHRIR